MGVYVFGADGLDRVKVGFTSLKTSRGRLNSCSTGAAGYRLREEAWFPAGTMENERRIHHLLKLAGAHIDREWFLRGHEAISLILMHARENNVERIIRYLTTHVRGSDIEAASGWSHDYNGNGVRIRIGNAKKLCSGCGKWLPLTDVHWGAFWRCMKDDDFRDQPRCVECRTRGYFKDEATLDMFGG